jgi:hypothetical protein
MPNPNEPKNCMECGDRSLFATENGIIQNDRNHNGRYICAVHPSQREVPHDEVPYWCPRGYREQPNCKPSDFEVGDIIVGRMVNRSDTFMRHIHSAVIVIQTDGTFREPKLIVFADGAFMSLEDFIDKYRTVFKVGNTSKLGGM